MYSCTFDETIKKGKVGEAVFIKDFLEFLNVKYEDVSGCQAFQVQGTDFIFPLGRVDIKNSYKSYYNTIVIEEYTNHAIKKPGWFDTSKAHLFVFVDAASRHMVFVPNTKILHDWYDLNKSRFGLKLNKPSYSKTGQWQSSFRVVDLCYIPHSFYHKGYIKTDAHSIKSASAKRQLILEDCFQK